jgi:hypothetical protein
MDVQMKATIEACGPTRGDEGIALITTLLVVLVAGALIMGAAVLGSNHMLIDKYWARQSNLVALADAGLEEGRALLNGHRSYFPDTGYVTLESRATVKDGTGNTIPGVYRSTYVGPTGITSGQYGVFGSLVSVVEDDGGGIAIRRQQVYQESFAKFAYFTDNEGGNIYFASNDHIWGPLHTNDQIKIHSSRANFHDEVTTAKDIYQEQYGTFDKGYSEYSPVIPMPETADLLKLKAQAQAGNTSFTGDTNGDDGEATTRIEFIAVDLNGDGDETDEDEGFMRIYQSSDWNWVSAKAPIVTYCSRYRPNGTCRTWSTGPNLGASEQCGDYHAGVFVAAASHPMDGHDASTALRSSSRVCYLGGDDRIWGGFVANDGKGQWLQWPGSVDPKVRAARPADADYLFPINRPLNPDFKGVIYLEGKVLISGKVRGQITLAATDNIIFGDDITYVTDPGAGSCEDMAGYFAGQKIVMSNNLLNAPAQPPGTSTYYTYDESTGDFFHGVVLALDVFTAEEYNTGSNSAQYCEGTRAGRGCIYLTGGIIQDTRGAVGLTDGTGYVKRYSYDQCAAKQPPPYFPTTGVFVGGQYYQVDPAGFSIDAYFRLMAPGS